MEPIMWLILLACFLVVEAITVGLTTIWFAGGALVAAIASGMGAGTLMQWLLFLIISLVLLIAAVYSSYYMRGDAGIYAGALGLSGILFALVGFIIGVKSFSGKNIKYKYPKIGSIMCGIIFVIWLGVALGGA